MEHDGLILPLPRDCFKVWIFLDVKCVKVRIAVVWHFSVVVPLEQADKMLLSIRSDGEDGQGSWKGLVHQESRNLKVC